MKSGVVFFSLLFVSFAVAQVPENIQRYRNDAKGNINYRKKGLLDGNRVRTVFMNDGQVSDWFSGAVSAPHLEWPKGTGHRNLDGYTFMVGAKVKTSGGKTITPIETSYREEMDYDPMTHELWGFEPIAGYANSWGTSVAMSNNNNSFPVAWSPALGLSSDWNGEWYGYFGKGVRDDVLETFYVMDDSRDKEFTYAPNSFYPVASDSDRGGLGLRVEVRGLQFQHQLLQDVIFWNYDVTNISDNDYDTTAFGMFIDPSIGSVNNVGAVNSDLSMVYAWAPSGKGLPNNYTTGYLGLSVLYSPNSVNNKNISSMRLNLLGDHSSFSVWPRNDNVMWNVMTGGFTDTILTNTDFTVVVGSNIFNFPKWTTKKYDIAMILGNDLSDITIKKYIAQNIHDNNFVVPDSISNLGQLTITSPVVNSIVSGTINVSWDVQGAAGKTVSYVYASSGNTIWELVGIDTVGSKSLQWNTSLFPDGIFYTIRIITLAENGIGILYNERSFTINNSGNAKPEIKINNPKINVLLQGNYNITWKGGDADGDSSNVNLFYKLKTESKWTNIVSNISSSAGSYQWDTKNIPNSSANDYELKAEINSNSDTTSVITSGFSIVNSFISKSGEPFIISKKSTGTGTINFNILDPSSITGHSYLLTFSSETELTGTITDLNLGEQKLTSIKPLDKNHETKTFDGIRLSIANDKVVSIDTSTTGLLPGFKTNATFGSHIDRGFTSINVAWPADYEIRFYNTMNDAGAFDEPSGPFIKDSVNFAITNITSGYRCKFLIQDMDANGKYSTGDTIRIIDGYKSDADFKICYTFSYKFKQGGDVPILPTEGDVFVIKTKKPFVVGDSIVFTSVGLVNVKKTSDITPSDFSLSQNYPNPFNPVTTIQFSIPAENNVELKIYDILGKEIALLVQERLQSGEYSVKFDGMKLSSGTYFMRLQSGDHVQLKKMILLK